MRILVADDEPHVTHALRFLFEKRGYEVVWPIMEKQRWPW
jgi:DNA-binding response OmpR family regulator